MKWWPLILLLIPPFWWGRFWLALRLSRLLHQVAERRPAWLFARRWARLLSGYIARNVPP